MKKSVIIISIVLLLLPFVAAQEICDDGVDNDADLFADCGDQDCSDFSACLCENGIQDSGEEDVDCGGNCSPCETCTPLWDCSWSECENGLQTKSCSFDRNRCGQAAPEDETRTCDVEVSREAAGVVRQASLSDTQLPEIVEEGGASPLKVTILIIGILFIIAGIAIAVYEMKKKKEEIHGKNPPIGQKKVLPKTKQMQKIKVHAEKAVQQGKQTPQIKKELKEKGAKKPQTEQAVMHAKAKAYITYQLKKGLTKEQIIKQLKSRKWSDKAIAQLFKELGK